MLKNLLQHHQNEEYSQNVSHFYFKMLKNVVEENNDNQNVTTLAILSKLRRIQTIHPIRGELCLIILL